MIASLFSYRRDGQDRALRSELVRGASTSAMCGLLVAAAAIGSPLVAAPVEYSTTAGVATPGVPSQDATLVGGLSGPVRLHNVQTGVAATDAANVAQVTAAVSTATANAVQYDVSGGTRQNTATLIGGLSGTVKLANVSPGTLSAVSTDATNGSQLFTTNTNVAANAAAIAGVNAGTSGTVQRTGTANGLALIAPGGTGAAPGTAQTLGNVAAGVAATDAANVGQVAAAVGAGTANAVQYDVVGGVRQNSATLVGGLSGPVRIGNVAAGSVAPGSTDAVNGAQLAATNAQVTTNTTTIASNTAAITNLSTSISNGSTGLVRQTGGSPGAGQITVGATTGGTSVSIAGTSGPRTLTGLANGVSGTDAVTVAQVNAITGGSLNAVQYDSDGAGGRSNTVSLAGGAAGPVKITNLAAGTVAAGSTDAVTGGQLAATNAGLAAANSQVAANTANIVTNTNSINAVLTGQAGAFRSNNAAAAPAPVASGLNATAGGFGASATGARGVALGNGAVSTGTNSVALGAGSSDGGAANVVSVGTIGGERRVTNVGPAVSGTDAVNLAQLQGAVTQFQTGLTGVQQSIAGVAFDLNRFKKRANAGTAGAMAVAGLPQAFTPGAGMLAAAVGTWQDQVAFAVGASKIVSDQVIVKAGASFSTRGSGGANAGVGVQF